MTLHPTHTGQPGRSETTRSTSQPTRDRQVDVAAIRRDYPIEDVVAAAGIELRPAGRGYIGHCPFHDDTTPSLSVAGVPDWFTCLIMRGEYHAGVGLSSAVKVALKLSMIEWVREEGGAPLHQRLLRRHPGD